MFIQAAGGAEIYYEEQGRGEPVLLVPGLGAHSGIWGPFPKMFSERRRVIVYDPRGLGRSTRGNEPLTLDLMVKDAEAVLQAAGGEKTAVLGVSLGSLIALQAALQSPQKVSHLILVTPAGFRSRYGSWLLETLRLLAERLAPQEFSRALTLLSFAPPFFERRYGVVKEVSRMLTPSTEEMDCIRRQLEALQESEPEADLSALDMPVLIIAGRRDALAPIEGARQLASKIRRCQLLAFPDAGHSPLVEQMEETVKAIEKFFSGR